MFVAAFLVQDKQKSLEQTRRARLWLNGLLIVEYVLFLLTGKVEKAILETVEPTGSAYNTTDGMKKKTSVFQSTQQLFERAYPSFVEAFGSS